MALIVSLSGCCCCTSGTQPIPAPTAAPAAPGEELTWYNGNVGAITGTAKSPTKVTFDTPVKVTYVETYHWNGGKGITPGKISLEGDDGTVYGPWDAVGMEGQGGVNNAYWIVRPDVTLKAGTYTVIDSDPSTWSTNAGMGNAGQTKIRYYEL
jgi:hypothetical protein